MRFWDASAVVPLLVEEATSATMRARYAEDAELAVWWGSLVECLSAVARRERAGAIAPEVVRVAVSRIHELAGSWIEMAPSQDIRETALRLVRSHDLRAADALQLAAALQAAEGQASTLDFVCLDSRLSGAAAVEGFTVVGTGA